MIRPLLILLSLISLYLVEDISMEPRLHGGDRIIVIKSNRFKTGQMGVLRSPQGVLSVKTCVLTPGDRIHIRGNFLVTDWGDFFLQPHQKEQLVQGSLVSHRNYFFVGENSFHSQDSRDWGFIEKKDIIGKVVAVRRKNR